MVIGKAVIKLYAPWVHSLKEKRMLCKSLVEKAKHRFNISVAEVDAMDIHQTIIICICCVSNSAVHANTVLNRVVDFMEAHTEAVVEDVLIELI